MTANYYGLTWQTNLKRMCISWKGHGSDSSESCARAQERKISELAKRKSARYPNWQNAGINLNESGSKPLVVSPTFGTPWSLDFMWSRLGILIKCWILIHSAWSREVLWRKCKNVGSTTVETMGQYCLELRGGSIGLVTRRRWLATWHFN